MWYTVCATHARISRQIGSPHWRLYSFQMLRTACRDGSCSRGKDRTRDWGYSSRDETHRYAHDLEHDWPLLCSGSGSKVWRKTGHVRLLSDVFRKLRRHMSGFNTGQNFHGFPKDTLDIVRKCVWLYLCTLSKTIMTIMMIYSFIGISVYYCIYIYMYICTYNTRRVCVPTHI